MRLGVQRALLLGSAGFPPASPARESSPPSSALWRTGFFSRDTSPEVPFPFSARRSCRAVRVCRPPDDPASAFPLSQVIGGLGIGFPSCRPQTTAGLALAVFRSSGCSAGPYLRWARRAFRRSRDDAPPGSSRRPLASRDDPLSRTWPISMHLHQSRRRSWGFMPFAVLLLPHGRQGVFAPARPLAVSQNARLDPFSSSDRPSSKVSSPTSPVKATTDRGRLPRLLGFHPAGNPCRHATAYTGRYCPGLRLSQVLKEATAVARRCRPRRIRHPPTAPGPLGPLSAHGFHRQAAIEMRGSRCCPTTSPCRRTLQRVKEPLPRLIRPASSRAGQSSLHEVSAPSEKHQ